MQISGPGRRQLVIETHKPDKMNNILALIIKTNTLIRESNECLTKLRKSNQSVKRMIVKSQRILTKMET